MSGIKPAEAHRVAHFQGKEKIMRRYPLAGDTEQEDATFVLDDDDEEDVDEAPMSVTSAVPPVASSAQIQTNLSSFIKPASAADVARQMLRLTDADIQGFTSSCNTLHYLPILSKLLCMQTSLAARFETIRLDEARAAAPARTQRLLAPLLPPQQMPAPTEDMQSVRVEDCLQPEPVPSDQIAAPLQIEGETAQVDTRTKRKRGGQTGPRKQRCFTWTGHWPPSAALSAPSALGQHRRAPARSPAVAQLPA